MSYTFFNNIVQPLENEIKFVSNSIINVWLIISKIVKLHFEIIDFVFKVFISYEFIIYLAQFLVHFLKYLLLYFIINMWKYFCFNTQSRWSFMFVLQVYQVLELRKLLSMLFMPVGRVFDLLEEIPEKRLTLIVDLFEDLFELFIVLFRFFVKFFFKHYKFTVFEFS